MSESPGKVSVRLFIRLYCRHLGNAETTHQCTVPGRPRQIAAQNRRRCCGRLRGHGPGIGRRCPREDRLCPLGSSNHQVGSYWEEARSLGSQECLCQEEAARNLRKNMIRSAVDAIHFTVNFSVILKVQSWSKFVGTLRCARKHKVVSCQIKIPPTVKRPGLRFNSLLLVPIGCWFLNEPQAYL